MKCLDEIVECLNRDINDRIWYAENYTHDKDTQTSYAVESGVITAIVNKNPELDIVWIETENNNDYKNICDYILSKLTTWEESIRGRA